jgi:ectoine hydroxylase-related dioxygenase (phytanoyl-CoA dioxygenase family)
LTQLASSPRILEFVRALGLAEPALMHSYNVRMDLPSEDHFLFHWHQDITYLLGSTNSMTLWIPLGPANAEHGSVEVVPGSHRDGVQPFVFTGSGAVDATRRLSPNDVRLKQEPSAGQLLAVERGDLVVFSQFLLHRSTPNSSSSPRWTAQLRFSDLMDPAFRAAEFPFGDATNIYHTSYLGNWSPDDE